MHGRPQMTDTIKLEFSNYARVEITRRGRGSSVHYDFDYWGTKYQWKKTVRRKSGQEDVSYCLYASKRSSYIASIDFAPLTPAEYAAEERKGGWVMPCSIRINDRHVFENADDVADVIVATGLMALVDDSIRHHWPQESPSGSSVSITDTVTKALEKIFHIHPHIHDIKNRRWHQKATRDNALRRFASHG
ncbi:hypothetical protein KEM56_002489 [Ascosphaera pollenicola]|nr:hypothetical protein KEM56_002489 [Ascosphaera pollenicola]